MKSFDESLQRLHTDYIDILFIHDIGRLMHGEAHEKHCKDLLNSGYQALTLLREQKLIRAIGLGVNEWEICLDLFPYFHFDCVMLAGRYTLLEQKALKYFFPACKERNISIIIAGPFNSGILAGGRHYNYQEANHDILKKVQQLQSVCREQDIELAHAALQFPLQHLQITTVLAGCRNEIEIQFAAKAIHEKIPDSLWTALKKHELIDKASL